MFRLLASGFALALLLGIATGDDKKETKDKVPLVAWTGGANGVDMKMEVGKGVLKINAFTGGDGVIVTCKTTVDKEGLVMAEVTDVELKGAFPAAPPKGLKFSFKWKEDGKTATLSDLMGKGIEEYKDVVEGKYEKYEKK